MLLSGAVAIYALHGAAMLAGLGHGPLDAGHWPPWWVVVTLCALWVIALQAYCLDGIAWAPFVALGMGILVVLINTLGGGVSFVAYGDAGYLPMVIAQGERFSRWLLGTAVLSDAYPAAHALLGVSAAQWVEVLGGLVMAAFMVAIMVTSRGRLAYLFPLMTPMWMVFSSGYDEYYPFIAGVYVYFVILMYQRELPNRYWVPILSAAMPLLYIAFAPLGALLLIRYWIDHPASRAKSLCLSAVVYIAGLVALWPGGPVDYVSALYLDLNLGEVNTAYAPYQGASASDYSPFFSLSYALSLQHGRELLYMLLAGTGVVIPLLLLVGLVVLAVRGRAACFTGKPNLSRVLFIAFVLWQILYFVFMIPKLGPFVDIDLFFSVYFLLAMLAGLICDKWISYMSDRAGRLARYYLVAACLGAGLGSGFLILLIGVLPKG